MPRRRKPFAKFEVDFVLADARFRRLTAHDRACYVDLWVYSKKEGKELLATATSSPAFLARIWHCKVVQAAATLQRLAKGDDPLIRICAKTGLVWVCGAARVHGRMRDGDWVVRPFRSDEKAKAE